MRPIKGERMLRQDDPAWHRGALLRALASGSALAQKYGRRVRHTIRELSHVERLVVSLAFVASVVAGSFIHWVG